MSLTLTSDNQKAAQASETTPGSVVMEFQGPTYAERAAEILATGNFAGQEHAFLSADSATARYVTLADCCRSHLAPNGGLYPYHLDRNMADLVFQQWRPTI